MNEKETTALHSGRGQVSLLSAAKRCYEVSAGILHIVCVRSYQMGHAHVQMRTSQLIRPLRVLDNDRKWTQKGGIGGAAG